MSSVGVVPTKGKPQYWCMAMVEDNLKETRTLRNRLTHKSEATDRLLKLKEYVSWYLRLLEGDSDMLYTALSAAKFKCGETDDETHDRSVNFSCPRNCLFSSIAALHNSSS